MNDNELQLCSVVIVAPYTVRIIIRRKLAIDADTRKVLNSADSYGTPQVICYVYLHCSIIIEGACCSYTH